MLNIDTAEIYGVKKESEEYRRGMLSKVRVEDLLVDKDLVIKTYKDKRGKYGRYLCEIFVNNENIGELLVKEGLAVYKIY